MHAIRVVVQDLSALAAVLGQVGGAGAGPSKTKQGKRWLRQGSPVKGLVVSKLGSLGHSSLGREALAGCDLVDAKRAFEIMSTDSSLTLQSAICEKVPIVITGGWVGQCDWERKE